MSLQFMPLQSMPLQSMPLRAEWIASSLRSSQ
jgi:hypothetical protein